MRLVLVAALCLGGCVQTYVRQPTIEEQLAEVRAKEARDLVADARAAKIESAAKGEKLCRITNVQGLSVVGSRTDSAVPRWRVEIGRGYPLPGSFVYILIGGKRYSEREDRPLPLTPDMLLAFKADEPATIAWSQLDRAGKERTVTLTNFLRAYEECIEFLSAPAS